MALDGYAEGLLEERRSHDEVNGTFGHRAPIGKEQHAIGQPRRGVEVVHRGDAGESTGHDVISDEPMDRRRVPNVEMSRRLVEQEDRCSLSERASDVNPLPLSARQLGEGALDQRQKLATVENFVNNSLVLGGGTMPAPLMRCAPHGHDLANRELDRTVRSLGHESDAARQLHPRRSINVETTHLHRTRP